MPRATKPPQAVLFDLDGTLLDSAADLCVALNRTLAAYQRTPLPLASVRANVSKGTDALLSLGFARQEGNTDWPQWRAHFLNHYADVLGQYSTLFAGVNTLIAQLKQRHIHWGIVTNKAQQFSAPLIAKLNFSVAPATLVSGDTLNVAKPHPQPLYYAAQQLQCPPDACWYVGDAERDIEAARAAQMSSVLARYGYIDDIAASQSWQADYSIDNPLQLIQLIDTL